jgi:hypothetical protein
MLFRLLPQGLRVFLPFGISQRRLVGGNRFETPRLRM